MRTAVVHALCAVLWLAPSVAADPPHSAAAVKAAVDFQCSGHAMPPIGESFIVRANAFQSCEGGPGWRMQRLVIEIQRNRWYGWQTVQTEDSGYVNDPYVERTALYKCLGTGDFNYRTQATGYVANGTYKGAPVLSLGTTRVVC